MLVEDWTASVRKTLSSRCGAVQLDLLGFPLVLFAPSLAAACTKPQIFPVLAAAGEARTGVEVMCSLATSPP